MHQRRIKALVQDLKSMVSRVQKKRLLERGPLVTEIPAPTQVEEEKKDEPDGDKSFVSDNGSDDEVDLENLPADYNVRFELLGIDTSILQLGDKDLILVMEMSAIDEIRGKQDRKKAEKAAKEAEHLAEIKRKEKEEQKKLMDQGSVQMFKFDISCGNDAFDH